MPKFRQTHSDPFIEAALAACAEFESPSAWGRSTKGNLCRQWDGVTLTIFKRDDECFGWCIADGEETRYSSGKFDSEEEAMGSLGEAVGIGV